MSRKNKKYTKLQHTGGGYGIGNTINKPATGQNPQVNPFMLPKSVGLDYISKMFPSNYYVEWSLQSWREACNQAMRMGFPISYATLVVWAYQSSAFIQSLFSDIGQDVEATPFYLTDEFGNQYEDWTNEICNKTWFIQLKKEILYSKFWGFTGLNISPVDNYEVGLKSGVYKYPMQNIDPINRMLRGSTYGFNDGVYFSDSPNLLFIQPSTSEESFLGWMQPITRAFIQMNLNSNNWVAIGRNVAFPLFTIGYPSNSDATDEFGSQYNVLRAEAEAIAQNIDPTQGLVFPYTRNSDGTIQKNLEIELVGGAAGSTGMHKLYSDFNNECKTDILQLVFNSTLTSQVGISGSRALGEVHAEKREQVKKSNIEFVESVLNDEFIRKIATFYKNFPKNAKFVANKSKQWKLAEVKEISLILNQNGKKLTDKFFENMGLDKELIEALPTESIPDIPQPKKETKQSFLDSVLKKKLIIA